MSTPDYSLLKSLVYQGAEHKKLPVTDEVLDRLSYELQHISLAQASPVAAARNEIRRSQSFAWYINIPHLRQYHSTLAKTT